MRLSSNMIGDSDYKINFPHELSLTNRQVANLRKALANYSSTDIKYQKFKNLRRYNKEDFLVDFLVHH